MYQTCDFADPYTLEIGGSLHCRLLDLIACLRGEKDFQLLQLAMGGASVDEVSASLGESTQMVIGRLKRLKRAVHEGV